MLRKRETKAVLHILVESVQSFWIFFQQLILLQKSESQWGLVLKT